MIHAIDFKGLLNGEYLQFMEHCTKLVNDADPGKLKVKDQAMHLNLKLAEADALFKLPLANSITTELLAIDLERDNAITGISFVIKGYLLHFDPKIVTAAKELDSHLKLYGSGIARLNYQLESATITNILNDWHTKPKLSDAIVQLGLQNWMTELNHRNKDFIVQYSNRIKEYGTETQENLQMKRKEVNEAYYELRSYLLAHSLISKSNDYKILFNELNVLIDSYNTLMAKRKPEKKEGKKEKKKDEGETPTEE